MKGREWHEWGGKCGKEGLKIRRKGLLQHRVIPLQDIQQTKLWSLLEGKEEGNLWTARDHDLFRRLKPGNYCSSHQLCWMVLQHLKRQLCMYLPQLCCSKVCRKEHWADSDNYFSLLCSTFIKPLVTAVQNYIRNKMQLKCLSWMQHDSGFTGPQIAMDPITFDLSVSPPSWWALLIFDKFWFIL